MSAEPAALAIEDVHVRFGGNQVLRGVSLAVAAGFTGLIGPNGAGKTTLLNVISGYVVPGQGRVLLGGAPITGLRPHQVAGRGIARTFQTPKLVRELTVLENVMLGLDARAGWLGGGRRARAAERADALLHHFGLAGWRDRDAASLPLSSQKVVEVARALVANPRVVLLDEPAAGLGVEDVDRLIRPLQRHAAEHSLAVLIIEHDIELISHLCPRIAVLDFGKVIAEGQPANVLELPDVVRAYLGAGFATAG